MFFSLRALTHCNVPESQAHPDIQDGKCDRSLQCVFSVQYKPNYIGCEGNQQAIQDVKHAKQ